MRLPPDCVLNVDVVAKHLGHLDALTKRVAPCRFSSGGLGQCVDRVAGDPKRRARSFCDEHEGERVKRPGPFYELRVLKAEGVLLRDKYVTDDEIVAAGAAQPGCVPCVHDLALR